jgi:serine/threonine protein kinase
MLKQLAPMNHPHLIKLLGTYHHQRSYHLMFPYATENLRGYWQRVGKPWDVPELIRWTFRQLRGIASGLETIHEFSIEDNSDIPHRLTVRSVQHDDTTSQWGRHGDIKPENILWFEDDANGQGFTDDHGLLVLADFGLMEFHGRKTRSCVDPESIGGTPTYEPPEKRLRLPISRAFDIWSMGCMMLEFITWLLESSKGVNEFSDFRAYPVYDALEIDAFDRMTSRELVRELDNMLERANNDKGYMFSTRQNSSISRKSALRYDSSTEDLRKDGGGKRAKVSQRAAVDEGSDDYPQILVISAKGES